MMTMATKDNIFAERLESYLLGNRHQKGAILTHVCFVAVRRMTGKTKILSRYVRQYEKQAKTPYIRILEHPAVSDTVKTRLREEHARLNPLVLKREIERRITQVYAIQKRYGNRSW